MGVFKRRQMYRTDTGRNVAVANMEVSHLMNAIGHHYRQIGTLDKVMKHYDGDLSFVKERKEDLEATIEILEDELIERDPANDPEQQTTNEY